jgi:hypothetical protein
MSETFYKIRKKGSKPPLYSNGGSNPRWTAKGKKWSTIGHLKQHLANVGSSSWRNYNVDADYVDGEIVEFVAKPKGKPKDVADLLSEVRQKKLEDEAAREAALREERRQEELRRLRELQAKYPDA